MARCFYCCHCGKCGPGSYDPHRLTPGACPFCNAKNDLDARVCVACGKPLPLAAGAKRTVSHEGNGGSETRERGEG